MPVLSHKIRLDPNGKQEHYFRKCCGTTRFTYNWALEEWQAEYRSGGKPTALSLKKKFNAIRREQFPWTYEVGRDCTSQAFTNLNSAYKGFFERRTGYPKFKKKGHRDSFYIANDKFSIVGKRVRLPHIGWVKLREELRFEGKILSSTVSRHADQWYISVQVEVPNDYKKERKGNGTVGVDLGITTAATLSTGKKVKGPSPLRKNLRKLKRLQRRLNKKQKGSKNREKARRKVARLHKRIADIRLDFLHKLTSKLLSENQTVVIEDLNVNGMIKNRKLARAISDIGLYEFRRQLTYKSQLFDSIIVVADRWFPSSKLCSACGHKKDDLTLSDRTYSCPSCGLSIDRDINAAMNLHTLGLRGIEACGPESSGTHVGECKTVWVEAGTMPCSLVNTR